MIAIQKFRLLQYPLKLNYNKYNKIKNNNSKDNIMIPNYDK